MADPLFRQCLDAVQTVIQDLDLSGISDSDIRVQKLPWQRTQVEPGIFITPITEKLDPRAGTNARDDIGYGVQVVIVQKSNQSQTDNLTTELTWRQRIRRSFHNKRLSGVTEVNICYVEPGAVVLPSLFEEMYDVQSLIIRCMSRELRDTAAP